MTASIEPGEPQPKLRGTAWRFGQGVILARTQFQLEQSSASTSTYTQAAGQTSAPSVDDVQPEVQPCIGGAVSSGGVGVACDATPSATNLSGSEWKSALHFAGMTK